MAERNLNALLSNMQPQLDSEQWAFCTVDPTFPLAVVNPLMVFHEDEGTTIVVKADAADRYDLRYEGRWSRITAKVHSALNAVGFIAELARCLTERAIPANTVSAYYHDHLFVPAERAIEALQALEELSAAATAC